MGCDRANHAGAVKVRLLLLADRVVLLDEGAGEIGMVHVDRGIDHRDQHAAAGRHLVHLTELQLADDVLLRCPFVAAPRQIRIVRR